MLICTSLLKLNHTAGGKVKAHLADSNWLHYCVAVVTYDLGLTRLNECMRYVQPILPGEIIISHLLQADTCPLHQSL